VGGGGVGGIIIYSSVTAVSFKVLLLVSFEVLLLPVRGGSGGLGYLHHHTFILAFYCII